MKKLYRIFLAGVLTAALVCEGTEDFTVLDPTGVLGAAKKFGESGRATRALAIEGDRLYAGDSDAVYVFDISSPLAPRLLGEVRGFGGCRQIAVQNGMAYVTAREYGLWIVDATDPTKPRIRSRFDSCELATGVDVAGDVCFCGQRQNGVEFIDVSNPDDPRHIAMRKTDESQSVVYRDGYLYSGDWGTGHVTVFDAHDMKDIRQVDHVELYGFGDGVCLDGDFLYVSTGHHSINRKTVGGLVSEEIKRFGGPKTGGGMGHGLDIFDIKDPAHPKRLGRVDFPPLYSRFGGDWWSPRVSGDLCFCAQTLNGLRVVDVSDKTAPREIAFWGVRNEQNPELPSKTVSSIAIGNGAIYVAVEKAGFYVIKCDRARRTPAVRGRPPANASYREAYQADGGEWHVWKPHDVGQCRGLAVRGDVIYAACGDAGLYALEVLPEGGGLRELGKLPGHDRVYDVAVQGDLVYTAEGHDGMGVYDVSSSPANFVEKARMPRITATKQLVLNVWTPKAGWIGVSDRHGVEIFATGKFPKFVHHLHLGGAPGWDRYLADAPVGDGRYLAYNVANKALTWVDLAAEPKATVSVTTRRNRCRLTNGYCSFDGGRKAIGSGNGFFYLLNPNEGDPADGGEWPKIRLPKAFPDERRGMIDGIPRADGSRVVFTSRILRRAALYDLQDVKNPKLVKAWKFSGNPDIAVFHRGRVVIPCGYEGVLLQR